jgi:hypothetical protein
MIYAKLPDRVIYGLLRDANYNVQADLFIEESPHYTKYDLATQLKRSLNIQSLYRGEHYYVSACTLMPKGSEIGLETMDLILGIMRNIMRSGDPSSQSKKQSDKNSLILSMLREDDLLLSVLNKVRFFYWNNMQSLQEQSFMDYVMRFAAANSQIYFAPK